MKRRLSMLASGLAATLALVATGCGSGDNSPAPANGGTTTGETVMTETTPENGTTGETSEEHGTTNETDTRTTEG